MSYGTNLQDAYREVGIYAGRILNGEKPADLPFRSRWKFELVIKHDRPPGRLAFIVPITLLARADE